MRRFHARFSLKKMPAFQNPTNPCSKTPLRPVGPGNAKTVRDVRTQNRTHLMSLEMQSLATRSRNGCFLLVVWLLSCFTSHSQELVSVPAPQVAPSPGGGGDSYMAFVSPDGRYVLFGSTANNLTAATFGGPYLLPRPQKINAFLRDRTMGTTTLV